MCRRKVRREREYSFSGLFDFGFLWFCEPLDHTGLEFDFWKEKERGEGTSNLNVSLLLLLRYYLDEKWLILDYRSVQTSDWSMK